MIVFLTLQPHLLGIFFASLGTLYTMFLLYIKDKYTYSELRCNYIYYSSKIEKWDIVIEWAAVL